MLFDLLRFFVSAFFVLLFSILPVLKVYGLFCYVANLFKLNSFFEWLTMYTLNTYSPTNTNVQGKPLSSEGFGFDS